MNQNLSSDIRSLPIGYVLSDYRIEGTLGHGAFGITYLATDTMLNRKVAIKEYFPREFAHRDGTLLVKPAGNKEDRDNFSWGLTRFLEEARVLALFDHPNIVPVRRFFEANGTAYLVMDYCDGIPLDSLISREGSLTKEQVLKILYPILDGLERVHKANFLHRDIKPANIFIKADGSPVLLDFGAARQEMLSHSRSVTSMATPGYAAFEQYSTHGKQGPWTDIYGLGATLYRAITGEKPQDAPDRILEDKLIPCLSLAAGKYEEKFLLAIDAAIAIRPENRPQSIAEWRRIFGLQQVTSSISESLSTQKETEVIHTSKQNSKDNRAELPTQKKNFTIAIGIGLTVFSLSLVTYFAMNDAGEQNKVASAVTPTPTPTPTPLPSANDAKSAPIKDTKPPPAVQEEKKITTLPPCIGEPNLKTWKNCRGTYTASSGKHAGDKYTGDFDENGNFTGNGTYTFANGDVYSGTLKEGVRTGKGTLTRANGTKYIGDWKNDLANGAGTLIFPSGDKYVGGFKDGKFSGRGTYSFTNGDKYVGNHENDMSNGFGVYTHADGRRFEGNYVDGQRNGFGTSYDAKGIKIYSGQWENGRVKADSSTPSNAPSSNLAKCNAYAAEAKKSLGLPKKIDSITTATDIFCLNTPGKPTFVYKYDVESELRFDQDVLESSIRANNRKLVCAPDIRMYLPIIDIEYQYYFSTSRSSFAPGQLIGKLRYSDNDCK